MKQFKNENFVLPSVKTLQLCLLVFILLMVCTTLILFSWTSEALLWKYEKYPFDLDPTARGKQMNGKECPIPVLDASPRSLQENEHVQKVPDCSYERLFSNLEGNDTV